MNAASENAASEIGARDGRLEGLLAEAREAVAGSANALRSVRGRFRDGHQEQVARWDGLRGELATAERGGSDWEADETQAGGLRRDEAIAAAAVGSERSGLERLDLAIQSLESAWLFLGQGDTSLIADPSAALNATDLQMRIVEAQEAERTRLAREVHDGPAQALSNAVFQIEIVERMLGRDPLLAAAELRQLRELLHRELGGVRAFISQLRPPILADLGLEGAIRDAASQVASVLGIPITVEIDPGIAELGGARETVALRVVQEALQNIRRHAGAHRVAIRGALEHGDWVVEIHDDGRGFDVGAVAARGRRNFGLQFMRERAELIGARFEVRSHPDGGTVVRIAIPRGAEESR
jgi:two-component system sensor histidine kinase DegS